MNTDKEEFVSRKAEQEQSFEIVDGPPRSDLFDSCMYVHDKDKELRLHFEIVMGYTMPPNHPGSAYIAMQTKAPMFTGISHEDGSGYSFNLDGYIDADTHSFGVREEEANFRRYLFRAYYNTRTRKGRITFLTD